MKGRLRINVKRFLSCLVHFQEQPGLPTRFTRQQHQPGVTAGRELHKNCTHLFWQKQPKTVLLPNIPSLGRSEKLLKERLENAALFKPISLMSLRLWDTPASLGRCALPCLHSSGFQAFPAQKTSAAVPSSWSHHIMQLRRANSSGLDDQARGLPSSLSQLLPPPSTLQALWRPKVCPSSANREHTQCMRWHLCPYKLSSLSSLIICPAFLDW